MNEYDDMRTEDLFTGDELREMEQAAEARLDAEDEARWAAEAAAAETSSDADDEDDEGDELWEDLADGEEY
ncbi:hypothetical protein [Streptomyces sp. DW26H14]|uniref:hypothetical protein n=1 Tax=Streptomyces sp. DW26H14 TaxID=3435395 RepID=UPI00403E129E